MRFLWQWVRNRLGWGVRPLELILHVTQRCPLRCRHCFLERKETNPGNDLPLAQIEALAVDLPNLMVLMLTGGEPFLRDDLPEIVRIFSQQSRPLVVSIATNGVLSDRVVALTKEILEQPTMSAQLILTLSWEGLEDAHDQNRCAPGAYRLALETARRLAALRSMHPALAIGANVTMLPGREADALEVAGELAQSRLFSFLTHNAYRSGRPNEACQTLDARAYDALARQTAAFNGAFFMGGRALGLWHRRKERYQSWLIQHLLQGGRSLPFACEAGRQIGVVYADGRVSPCELWPETWGRLPEASLSKIWNRRANRDRAEELRVSGCFCTHECFLSASLNTRFGAMLSCLAWRQARRHDG